MSSCYKAGSHPALPLSDTTVAQKVVAVHHSQLIQEKLYGALAPSFFWTFTLQKAQSKRVALIEETQKQVLTLPGPARA